MHIAISPDRKRTDFWYRLTLLILLSVGAWFAILLLYYFLDFNPLWDSDSRAYWVASQNLETYPPLELPGYPIAVAFTQIFFERPVESLAYSISAVAYVGSVIGVYHLLLRTGFSYPWYGAVMFALYPLEGVTNSVFPRVNAFMYFWMVLSLGLYIRGHGWLTISAMAITLLTHKSTWPFVGILVVLGVYEKRWKWWWAPLTFIPLLLYWYAGVIFHNDILWLLDTSTNIKFESELATGHLNK